MDKCKILIADREISYLAPLEYQFLREYGSQIELQLISREDYLEKYLSSPHKIDILIISMELWRDAISRQGVRGVFLLSEEMPKGETDPRGTLIYKYTSPKEVFAEVNLLLRRLVGAEQADSCKLIAVYSPQGGCGKTTLSLGLLAALSSMGARGLYLSTASIQTYGALAQVQGYADSGLLQGLQRGSLTEALLARNIQQGKPSVLRPLQYSAVSSGIEQGRYRELCKTARNSRRFDYILVDIGEGLNRSTAQMMEEADYVLLPFTQSAAGRDSLEAVDRNIDLSDTEKYIPICNGYQGKKAAPIKASPCWEKIQETIDWEEPSHLASLDQLRACRLYQNLAYRFI